MKANGYLNSSGGITALGVLAVVFIVLKLVGVIEWSWWLVLIPVYGPFLLAGLLLVAAFLVSLKK